MNLELLTQKDYGFKINKYTPEKSELIGNFNNGIYNDSYLFGMIVTNEPFIHENGALNRCTCMSVYDNISGVYSAGHLNIGSNKSELKKLELMVDDLDKIMSKYGSKKENRKTRLIFGTEKFASQHKNIYELFNQKGFNVVLAYQSISSISKYKIDNKINKVFYIDEGIKKLIPEKINPEALENSKLRASLDRLNKKVIGIKTNSYKNQDSFSIQVTPIQHKKEPKTVQHKEKTIEESVESFNSSKEKFNEIMKSLKARNEKLNKKSEKLAQMISEKQD